MSNSPSNMDELAVAHDWEESVQYPIVLDFNDMSFSTLIQDDPGRPVLYTGSPTAMRLRYQVILIASTINNFLDCVG